MSIKDRLQAVKRAELDCKAQSDNMRSARQSLATNFGDAATPWRIVTAGAIAGFLLGRVRGLPMAMGVGGKLFGSIARVLISTLGAQAIAGAEAEAAEAAEAAADATTEEASLGTRLREDG